MSRQLERNASVAGVLVLLGSLAFAASLIGPWLFLPASLLLGAGLALLWHHFELPGGNGWVPALLCALIVLAAAATSALVLHPGFAIWFAPLLAAASCATAAALLQRNSRRCALCNRGLATQNLTFQCPRCHQVVCEESCWSFEHRRCSLCLEQRVPLLSNIESWWLRVTGPRSTYGRCSVCLGGPEQLELHLCPQCRRPQCRECWDFHNGECQRCGAALPELPSALTDTALQNTLSGLPQP